MLAFSRILWYNVYMNNREIQTSNTEEMVTISRIEAVPPDHGQLAVEGLREVAAVGL